MSELNVMAGHKNIYPRSDGKKQYPDYQVILPGPGLIWGLSDTCPRYQISSPLPEKRSKDFLLSPGQPAGCSSEIIRVGIWCSDNKQKMGMTLHRKLGVTQVVKAVPMKFYIKHLKYI